MKTTDRRRSLIFIGVAALLLTGCGDALLTKEQRKLNDGIKQAVRKNPERINAPYQDGEPPLHLALSNNLSGLAHWLLARKSDANARDRNGQTALHDAVFVDVKDQTWERTLIAHGADVNAKRNDGSTPLHLAAFLSRAACVEYLLSAGADPNARNQQGDTPLHEAATPQPTASPENAALTIHLLVAGGADPAAHRTNGDTPLHMAALIGSALAARTLLKEGAPVDAPGGGGGTALHTAATFGRTEIAEVLLQAGADPNRRDDSGLTPLGRALKYPAVTGNANGAGPVDTREVLDLLRRSGAVGPD